MMPVKARRVFPFSKGKEREKWVIVGAAFDVGGQINVVLDALPVWKDWDGSLVIFKESAT